MSIKFNVSTKEKYYSLLRRLRTSVGRDLEHENEIRTFDFAPFKLCVKRSHGNDANNNLSHIIVYAEKDLYDQLPKHAEYLKQVNACMKDFDLFTETYQTHIDSVNPVNSDEENRQEFDPRSFTTLSTNGVHTCYKNDEEHNSADCNNYSATYWHGTPILVIRIEHVSKINGLKDKDFQNMLQIIADYLISNIDTISVTEISQKIPQIGIRGDIVEAVDMVRHSNDYMKTLSAEDQQNLRNGRLVFLFSSDYNKQYDDYDEFCVNYPVTGDFTQFFQYVTRVREYSNLELSNDMISPMMTLWTSPAIGLYHNLVLKHLNETAPKGTIVDNVVILQSIAVSKAIDNGLLKLPWESIIQCLGRIDDTDTDKTIELLVKRASWFTNVEIYNNKDYTLSAFNQSDPEVESLLLDYWEEDLDTYYNKLYREMLLRAIDHGMSAVTLDEFMRVIIDNCPSYRDNSKANARKIFDMVVDNGDNIPLDLLLKIHEIT